jgi:hypothetical protein
MDKKIGLEHTIRNVVSESIGVSGTDKYQGTPKAFLKPAPLISPKKGDEHPNGSATLAQRGGAKIGGSKKTGTMRLEGKIGVEHTIRNVLTKKNDAELIQEPKSEKNILDNELEEGLKSTVKQAATDIADYGALGPYATIGGDKARSYLRGLKSTATMGAGDYVRAGMDYGVKNLGSMVGIGKGTTMADELADEAEKTKKAQEKEPKAYTAGELTGVAAPAATGVGGVVTAGKIAGGLAKGIYNTVKNPGSLKKLSTYVDTAKAILKPQNPVSTAKDVASIGVAIEGGKLGLSAAKDKDFRDYLKDKTSKPGGTTDVVSSVGKGALDIATPGLTDAAQGKDVGRNLSRTAGAVAADVFLPTMAYDLGSQLLGGQGISGKDGLAAQAYDKFSKSKKKPAEITIPGGGLPVRKESYVDTVKKVLKENRLGAVKDLKTLKLAPDLMKDFEAWKAAKEAEEAAKAGKPAPKKPSPGKTEPGREGKPYVDKPANQPGGPNVTPFKAPNYVPPYRPDTSPKFPGVPANPAPGAPKVTPKRVRPDDLPPPANPPKVEPPKEKPTVKPPKEKPQRPPDQNPFPDKPAEVKPKAPPIELPKKLEPPPYTSPKQPSPAVRPEVPGAFPAKPKPAETKPIEEPVPVAKPDPIKKKTSEEPAPVKKSDPKKEEGKKTDSKKPEGKKPDGKKPEVKPPIKRFPFWWPSFGPSSGTPGKYQNSNVDVGVYKHMPKEYMHFEETQFEADAEVIKRKTRKAQIIRKIIDEKKAEKKDTSTVILNPKLKTQEPDQT